MRMALWTNTLVDAEATMAIKRVVTHLQLSMVNFAKLILPTEVKIMRVLNATLRLQTAKALLVNIRQESQPIVFRSLACLVKLGVLKVIS